MAYSFISFLRQGIANGIRGIADPSKGGSPVNTGAPRANVDVTVNVKYDDGVAEPLPKKKIELYGPGDVIGLDKTLIIRTDPQHYSTIFEPKHLAFIEFYDEDLPWRFSPTAVNDDNRKLTPWLALIVLEPHEFIDETPTWPPPPGGNKPLPNISITDAADRNQVFSPFNNLSAWAHVHVNGDVVNRDADGGVVNDPTVTGNIRNVLDKDGDYCYSRIVCPRRLSANKAYHAFLVPAFETGRLAGLGKFLDMKKVPVTQPAWGTYDQKDFPYYYRWYFKTGPMGDFEYLVDQLKPRVADSRVGFKEIYADGITNNQGKLKPLYMPGALRVPLETLDAAKRNEIEQFENWEAPADPHDWQKKIANKLRVQVEDDEPSVTMPIYGQWHAGVEEILFKRGTNDLLPLATRKNWVHELNLDPRYRAVAALGTKVVQQHQEEFMDAAWEQVEEIREANRAIRYYQLAIAVNKSFQQNVLSKFSGEQLLSFTAPLHKKIRTNLSSTVFKNIDASVVPNAVSTNLLRKQAKPNGRIATVGKNRVHVFANTGQDINQKFNLATTTRPSGAASQQQFEKLVSNFITTHPAFISATAEERNRMSLSMQQSFRLETTAVEKLSLSNAAYIPVSGKQSPLMVPKENRISVFAGSKPLGKAMAITKALYDLQAQVKQEPKTALDIRDVTSSIFAGVNAAVNLKTRFVKEYPHLAALTPATQDLPAQIMKYPEFDLPMYLPLNELSTEYFLPNINLIPQNSITFLESNQRFIEVYMAGLNHEMSKELLWRGFPTDQRGSYFRNFWDSMTGEDQGINEMHTWTKPLGENSVTGNTGLLFLVIRGDLLNKYPNTVVSAQRADWGTLNGSKSVTVDRVIKAGSQPVLPLFEAKIEPDIYFLAFKIVENGRIITEKDLAGTEHPTSTNDDPGWFFVFQERPGEPRFGLDLNTTAVKKRWSDIAWADTGVTESNILNFQASITVSNDIQASWPPKDSAQLAYILYQQPVLVAIHASRLLTNKM